MDNFDKCIGSILEHEGGLTRDKRDPGGVTKWGVSLRFLKMVGLDLDKDGDIDEEDIVALSVPGAKEIYREFWWDKYQYDRFTQLVVVEKVFDLAVNMGGQAAHKLLQKSINSLGKPVAIDGILGRITIGAANSLDGNQLRQKLRQCAKDRYIEIINRNPAMEWAKKGWLNRARW